MSKTSLRSLLLVPGLILTASIFSAVDVPVKNLVNSVCYGNPHTKSSLANAEINRVNYYQQGMQHCQKHLLSILYPSKGAASSGCGPHDSLETCRTVLLESPCLVGMQKARSPEIDDHLDDATLPSHVALRSAVINLQATLEQVLKGPSQAATVAKVFYPDSQAPMTPSRVDTGTLPPGDCQQDPFNCPANNIVVNATLPVVITVTAMGQPPLKTPEVDPGTLPGGDCESDPLNCPANDAVVNATGSVVAKATGIVSHEQQPLIPVDADADSAPWQGDCGADPLNCP